MNFNGLIRSARNRFAATAAIILFPLLIIWWAASAVLLDFLRPGAEWMAVTLQMATSVTAQPSHDWLVNTGLERATGAEAGSVDIVVPVADLRRLLLSFPLFLALIAAPPRGRFWTSVALGYFALTLAFDLSVCSIIFNSTSVIINHRPSLVNDTIPPPPFTVTTPPLNQVEFFAAGLSLYVAMQVMPLALPIALWAGLNRKSFGALVQESSLGLKKGPLP